MNFISGVFSLLISLGFSVHISQPYESDGIAKHVFYVQVNFGINLIPKYSSKFPKYVDGKKLRRTNVWWLLT
jgi:hypothetical protein